MITYTYETIPADSSKDRERFEWRQSIHEPALEVHPETGVPVRRVITGGVGYLSSGGDSAEQSCCRGPCGC
ncbi:MAG: hypothetical protein CMP26_04250 [Roseibacillus sp.]|jgi:hypothetical protein|nr:hypothetical protein [Roseibacillus sp.]HAO97262.1 hypothetical protein [Verrucomicrobiales bacterium]